MSTFYDHRIVVLLLFFFFVLKRVLFRAVKLRRVFYLIRIHRLRYIIYIYVYCARNRRVLSAGATAAAGGTPTARRHYTALTSPGRSVVYTDARARTQTRTARQSERATITIDIRCNSGGGRSKSERSRTQRARFESRRTAAVIDVTLRPL